MINFFLLIFFSILFSNDIDLVTTNDLHGFIVEQDATFMNPMHPPKIIGGSGFYKYVQDNIDKDNSFILDGGNFFKGHPMSVVDSGKTMIEFMNKVGYTALVPGSDDFIYGSENLNDLASISDFPFLITNLECNDCDLSSDNFMPYFIKEIEGTKFGFLGIVDSELVNKIPSDKIKGIKITNLKDCLDKWSTILDSLADIKIILTSTGVPYDREIAYNEFIQKIQNKEEEGILNAVKLGYYADGTDLIIAGGVSNFETLNLSNGSFLISIIS